MDDPKVVIEDLFKFQPPVHLPLPLSRQKYCFSILLGVPKSDARKYEKKSCNQSLWWQFDNINIFYHQTDLLFQERNVSVLKTVMKVYFCHGFMPISFPVLIKEALESSMKKIGPTFVCYVGPGDE